MSTNGTDKNTMKRQAFFATIKDGVWPDWLRRAMADIAKQNDGQALVITVENNKRSNAMNRYYWGFVIRPIANALRTIGKEPPPSKTHEEWAHECFALRYLGMCDWYDFDGHYQPRRKSTTEITSSEMQEYIMQIQADDLVTSLGVFVPTLEQYQQLTGDV